jgi:hypothetical protein
MSCREPLEGRSRLKKKQFKLPSEIQTDCPLHAKLKSYHDQQERILLSIAMLKITPDILEVVEDVKLIDVDERQYTWSNEEQMKVSRLTAEAKLLRTPPWPWGASDDSEQGQFNHARMKLWKDRQCRCKLFTCPQCGVTVPLVGMEQEQYEIRGHKNVVALEIFAVTL